MEKHLDWRFSPFDVHGKLLAEIIAADGADASPFHESDVAEVTDVATTGNQFDGRVVAVVRLRDNRWVAFETSYASYAGNDFTDGKGVIFLAQSRESAASKLSDQGKILLERETGKA